MSGTININVVAGNMQDAANKLEQFGNRVVQTDKKITESKLKGQEADEKTLKIHQQNVSLYDTQKEKVTKLFTVIEQNQKRLGKARPSPMDIEDMEKLYRRAGPYGITESGRGFSQGAMDWFIGKKTLEEYAHLRPQAPGVPGAPAGAGRGRDLMGNLMTGMGVSGFRTYGLMAGGYLAGRQILKTFTEAYQTAAKIDEIDYKIMARAGMYTSFARAKKELREISSTQGVFAPEHIMGAVTQLYGARIPTERGVGITKGLKPFLQSMGFKGQEIVTEAARLMPIMGAISPAAQMQLPKMLRGLMGTPENRAGYEPIIRAMSGMFGQMRGESLFALDKGQSTMLSSLFGNILSLPGMGGEPQYAAQAVQQIQQGMKPKSAGQRTMFYKALHRAGMGGMPLSSVKELMAEGLAYKDPDYPDAARKLYSSLVETYSEMTPGDPKLALQYAFKPKGARFITKLGKSIKDFTSEDWEKLEREVGEKPESKRNELLGTLITKEQKLIEVLEGMTAGTKAKTEAERAAELERPGKAGTGFWATIEKELGNTLAYTLGQFYGLKELITGEPSMTQKEKNILFQQAEEFSAPFVRLTEAIGNLSNKTEENTNVMSEKTVSTEGDESYTWADWKRARGYVDKTTR